MKTGESYRAGRGHHTLKFGPYGMGDEGALYMREPLSVMPTARRGHKAVGIAVAVSLCRLAHPDYYTLTPDKGRNDLGVIDAVREVSERVAAKHSPSGRRRRWCGLRMRRAIN